MVETDLETGTEIHRQQQHWQEIEDEEKEDCQRGIGQVLAAEVGHIFLVEEVYTAERVAAHFHYTVQQI